jgi:hypothetical protein
MRIWTYKNKTGVLDEWAKVARVVNEENKTSWTAGACQRRFNKECKKYTGKEWKQRKRSGERSKEEELANHYYEILSQINNCT